MNYIGSSRISHFEQYIPPSVPTARKERLSEFQSRVAEKLHTDIAFQIPDEMLSTISWADGQCWLLDQCRFIRGQLDVCTAIVFLKKFGDGHLFKLYAAHWPGLTAYALLAATLGNDSKGELLDVVSEAALSMGKELHFDIEATARLASTCAGALCLVLLQAPATANGKQPGDHPLIEKLKTLQTPRIPKSMFSEMDLCQLRQQDDLRGSIARLIQLF
jgi:hypothetical protein